jgi:hypothetical protein
VKKLVARKGVISDAVPKGILKCQALRFQVFC